MEKLKSFVFLLLIVIAPSLLGECRQYNYLDFETGYRWDKVDNRIVIYGNAAASAAGQTFNKINSYQLGGRGLWMVCDPLFIKAHGHYGWILSGNFDQVTFTGDLDGHTWDAAGGIGYAWRFHPCWDFAPTIGWAYNELGITVTNVTTGFATPPNRISLSNIDCKHRVEGPWVGFDLLFFPSCCLDVSLSYELHKGRWRGDYFPDVGDFGPSFGRTTGFASKRTNDQMWGNLFRMEGKYLFCSCWEIGVLLNYEFWKGQYAGHFDRTITPLGPEFPNNLVIDVDWQSFSTMVQLGYRF